MFKKIGIIIGIILVIAATSYTFFTGLVELKSNAKITPYVTIHPEIEGYKRYLVILSDNQEIFRKEFSFLDGYFSISNYRNRMPHLFQNQFMKIES